MFDAAADVKGPAGAAVELHSPFHVCVEGFHHALQCWWAAQPCAFPRPSRALVSSGNTVETRETRQSVLLTQCAFVSLSLDQLLCLENTVATGSVKLIPDTQVDILMSFFPSQRPPLWPSGKASASRAEGPRFKSRLHRDFFGVESYL